MVGNSLEKNELHILVSSQFADILMKAYKPVFVISLCSRHSAREMGPMSPRKTPVLLNSLYFIHLHWKGERLNWPI